MLFISSRIGVENDNVGANAFEPNNAAACRRVGHEVVALILTGIRFRIEKRRRKLVAARCRIKNRIFNELALAMVRPRGRSWPKESPKLAHHVSMALRQTGSLCKRAQAIALVLHFRPCFAHNAELSIVPGSPAARTATWV